MDKNRVEAFYDAVTAIIMTILVLELQAPDGDSLQDILSLTDKFISYVLSFCTVAIYWHNHHHMFKVIQKIDSKVLWANTFLLFTLSLFPLATSWVGEHFNSRDPEILFGIVFVLPAIAYYLLTRTLISANKQVKNLTYKIGTTKKNILTIILGILAIVFGFFIPNAVIISCFIFLIIWLIPSQNAEKHAQK